MPASVASCVSARQICTENLDQWIFERSPARPDSVRSPPERAVPLQTPNGRDAGRDEFRRLPISELQSLKAAPRAKKKSTSKKLRAPAARSATRRLPRHRQYGALALRVG